MNIFGRKIVWSNAKQGKVARGTSLTPARSRNNLNGLQSGSGKSMKRNYDAAKSSRFMSSWTTAATPINYQITSQLHILLARSRHAYQNNDLVKRGVSLRMSKIVGHTGVRFVPDVKTSGSPEPKINNQVSELVKRLSKKGVLDAKGRLSFIDIQNRVERQLFIDGEYICIHRFGHEFEFGFAIDEIDPMLLPVDLNLDLKSGNVVRCGIELNKSKRVVAYHFVKEQKTSMPTNSMQYHKRETQRVLAKFVTHVFIQEFPDQLRGVPKIATSLFRIEVLRKYIEAELIGARIGASSAGFFVRQKDHYEPFTGQEGIDVKNEDEEDIEPDDVDDMEVDEVEAGTVKIAPVGYDFKEWNLNRPNSAFSDFLKDNTRAQASSMDVNYSAVANNYENVSFSALRDSKLTDEAIEKQSQVFLIEHFVEPILSKAILYALDFGKFVIKDPVARQNTEYTVGEYIPKLSKSVDPVKTAQAYRILNRDIEVISRERIARELDILNPLEELQRIKLENEQFPLHNTGVVPTPTSDKENEEDKKNAKDED